MEGQCNLSVHYLSAKFLLCWFQFKMKPQMHYGEDDCPVAAPSTFPKDEELHFEIEMIDFAKAKARYKIWYLFFFFFWGYEFSALLSHEVVAMFLLFIRIYSRSLDVRWAFHSYKGYLSCQFRICFSIAALWIFPSKNLGFTSGVMN